MKDSLTCMPFLLLLLARISSASLWTIMVLTSDVKEAGTTAHVFANISGTKRDRYYISLGKNHPQGGIQYFTANMAIGIPYRLTVWHDNTGVDPDWRLERIVLIKHRSWHQFMFVCKRWLSTNSSLVQILPASGHLYIPGTRKATFPVFTNNCKMNITVDDTMGRATVKAGTDTKSGQTDSFLITIESEHVFMGIDKFVIRVAPQKTVPETCEHTSSCLCYTRIQQNLTKADELNELVEALKRELTVDKKKTSVNLRRYISAEDSRPSSKAIGSVGAILLVVPVALVVLSDLINIFKTKKKRPWLRYSAAPKTDNSSRHDPPPEYTVSKENGDAFADEWNYACGSSIQTMEESPSSAQTDEKNTSAWSIPVTTNRGRQLQASSDEARDG
ncbi:uncharacterized protein LOC117328200 [Pecten maximus]|uniref:uncharacterized protein LOC117328200 n=1 Tax=Pecten maximus TaxID=6579 RepID=UPI001459158A|nr:uncharacterized protein LOC117328200 [Pecten maximus]